MQLPPLRKEICEKCPLGPAPRGHDACKRCDADAAAIIERDQQLEPDTVMHGEIDLTDAMAYMLLPAIIRRKAEELESTNAIKT